MTGRFIAIAVTAGALFLPVGSGAQSLGEAAVRAEEARRAASKTPSRAYTNKDLKDIVESVSSTPAPAVMPAPSVPTPTPIAETTRAVLVARDEAYWKDRMRVLELQLERDQRTLAAAVARAGDFADSYNAAPGGQRAIAYRALLDARRDIDRAEVATRVTQSTITQLEEEARLAGVPPGWLRPLQAR